MRYPKSHLSTVVLLFVAIAIVACEPAAEQPQPAEEIYHLNYAQIRRSHRRWSCGDSGTRVNSVISQVVFSAVSLPV